MKITINMFLFLNIITPALYSMQQKDLLLALNDLTNRLSALNKKLETTKTPIPEPEIIDWNNADLLVREAHEQLITIKNIAMKDNLIDIRKDTNEILAAIKSDNKKAENLKTIEEILDEVSNNLNPYKKEAEKLLLQLNQIIENRSQNKLKENLLPELIVELKYFRHLMDRVYNPIAQGQLPPDWTAVIIKRHHVNTTFKEALLDILDGKFLGGPYHLFLGQKIEKLEEEK